MEVGMQLEGDEFYVYIPCLDRQELKSAHFNSWAQQNFYIPDIPYQSCLFPSLLLLDS